MRPGLSARPVFVPLLQMPRLEDLASRQQAPFEVVRRARTFTVTDLDTVAGLKQVTALTGTPTAVAISVDYAGCGNTATGNTSARKIGGFSSDNTDWDAAAAHSWGLPNP